MDASVDHALSNGESEIMWMCEMLKECLLTQSNHEFIGMGKIPIEFLTDASVARAFDHRKGVGMMEYLEVRLMRLQEELEKGAFKLVETLFRQAARVACTSSFLGAVVLLQW